MGGGGGQGKGGGRKEYSPPSTESIEDDFVEYQVDDVPAAVIDASGGRHVVRPHEDERPVNLANKVGIRLLPYIVGNWRKDETDPEEVKLLERRG